MIIALAACVIKARNKCACPKPLQVQRTALDAKISLIDFGCPAIEFERDKGEDKCTMHRLQGMRSDLPGRRHPGGGKMRTSECDIVIEVWAVRELY